MDITNDSGTDTRYTVKNGSGSGMGGHHSIPLRLEDTAQWRVLAAGATDHLDTAPSQGPWTVCFFMDGQGYVADATSDNDQVHLVAAENGFQTVVRKVAHATGKVVIPARFKKSA
jgi:hypothetical protein